MVSREATGINMKSFVFCISFGMLAHTLRCPVLSCPVHVLPMPFVGPSSVERQYNQNLYFLQTLKIACTGGGSKAFQALSVLGCFLRNLCGRLEHFNTQRDQGHTHLPTSIPPDGAIEGCCWHWGWGTRLYSAGGPGWRDWRGPSRQETDSPYVLRGGQRILQPGRRKMAEPERNGRRC